MRSTCSVDDLILNSDPESPQERFRQAGLPAALKSSIGRLPGPVPWPQGRAPTAAPLPLPPAESDDLGRFRGYDAVVVTWTAAEAAALAVLFMPDYLPSRWYEYRHNVADYIPLVTGARAPFNDRAADMARYYHGMGLYMPCTIGSARVLLFKSGLHPAYDGPATPLRKLMIEITQTVQPKVMITTGTGGAIGADVLLGDVVVAAQTRFDCTKQFKKQALGAGVLPDLDTTRRHACRDHSRSDPGQCIAHSKRTRRAQDLDWRSAGYGGDHGFLCVRRLHRLL